MKLPCLHRHRFNLEIANAVNKEEQKHIDFIGDILGAPFICIGWIIVGAIAGSLARSIMKSSDMSFFSDLLLGIAGALIGGLLAGLVGLGPSEDSGGLGLVLINLVIATIGAMILIGGQRTLARAT